MQRVPGKAGVEGSGKIQGDMRDRQVISRVFENLRIPLTIAPILSSIFL
jgi:hypothetical protein